MAKPHPLLPLAAFATLGAVAVAAAPPVPARRTAETLPPPPSAAVMLATSLGRHAVAADVTWLRTVQFIGSPHSERIHYAGLPAWIELVNTLDPVFELPYYHGSILLSTEPQQGVYADDILVRAEQNLVEDACRDESTCVEIDRTSYDTMFATCAPCPALKERECNWAVPMARAFVAFFGFLDAKAASEHFCHAARRGGPYVTQHRAATLLKETSTCGNIRKELMRMVQAGETGGGAKMLSQNRLRIAVHCEEVNIKRALASYRVRFRTNPGGIQPLLDTELLREPPWRPSADVCWHVVDGDPELGACTP